MMIHDFLFYMLASVVLLTVLAGSIRAKSFRERVAFLLFFVLYAALTSIYIFWPEPSGWFFWSLGSVYLMGEFVFLMDPLLRSLHERHQIKTELRNVKKEKGSLFEIVSVCKLLRQAKQGGLIALERQEPLKNWCEKGTAIDGFVSRDLLFSIFTPPGALHDGAAVIRKDRILACGVVVPLSFSPDFPKDLGTRHRAAIGFSEAADALCIVVSEESGTVSIADRGSLYFDIPIDKLPEFLVQGLRFRLPKKKSLIQNCEVVRA